MSLRWSHWFSAGEADGLVSQASSAAKRGKHANRGYGTIA